MENLELNDFLKLTPEEQTAILSSASDMERRIAELEAERNSLNDDYNNQLALLNQMKTELQKTKEVNYSLARKITKEEKTPEELIHDMFVK